MVVSKMEITTYLFRDPTKMISNLFGISEQLVGLLAELFNAGVFLLDISVHIQLLLIAVVCKFKVCGIT